MSDFKILDSVAEHRQVYGEAFKGLPSIYAIELTAACDLACPMCLRTTDMPNKKPTLLDMKLLELMLRRGDFVGSSYIELQQAGEPTIHPKLGSIIRFLKEEVGVLVGASTHGLNMGKPGVVDALLMLDALTISVDSTDPEVYHKQRYPAEFKDLLKNLREFFTAASRRQALYRSIPLIELQVVSAPLAVQGSSDDTKALTALMQAEGWDKYATVRVIHDCFKEMRETVGHVEAGSTPRNDILCINPFTSVNVSQDGDVVSCCYIFDTRKDEVNYYGNLWEESLEQIWNGPRLQQMQAMHKNGPVKDQCAKCYYHSPELIHYNIVSRIIRKTQLGRQG